MDFGEFTIKYLYQVKRFCASVIIPYFNISAYDVLVGLLIIQVPFWILRTFFHFDFVSTIRYGFQSSDTKHYVPKHAKKDS